MVFKKDTLCHCQFDNEMLERKNKDEILLIVVFFFSLSISSFLVSIVKVWIHLLYHIIKKNKYIFDLLDSQIIKVIKLHYIISFDFEFQNKILTVMFSQFSRIIARILTSTKDELCLYLDALIYLLGKVNAWVGNN